MFFDLIDMATGKSFCRMRLETYSLMGEIRETVARHFECDEDDVDLVETDDHGETLTVCGEEVAFIQHVPYRGRPSLRSAA